MVGRIRPQHHIVYVPGLGDKHVFGQQLAVSTWRVFGVYGHIHPVLWDDDEAFTDKLTSLLDEIDGLLAAGHLVSLVGASAGASMVLHAYVARKKQVNGVALICGELAPPDKINPSFYEKNPAFKGSMELLPTTLAALDYSARKRIISIHPIYDETVDIADTYLENARMYTVISFGHAVTIGFALTIDAYIPLWFLDRLARKQH
jgi:pimeloyl-ACP methyl ester carboxylesterase